MNHSDDNSSLINSLAQGRAVIKKLLAELPHAPGVYRMLDAQQNVLYVGKAKSLRNRVGNYVNAGALNTRLQRMVSLTASMEIITTRSEAEALLLEVNLIKKYSPRYNILLKDDKSFPYILLSGDVDFPRLSKHRGAKTGKGKYFGPFVSAAAVDDTIALLQKAFLLRPCADTVFKNRTRPCLQYQIKRCSAPCVEYISKEDYGTLVKQAQDFLMGRSRQIQEELLEEMHKASEAMDYEKASILRDRVKSLTQVQQQHQLTNVAIGDADLVVMAREGGDVCVQIFSFRGGRNYGSRSYFPNHTASYESAEIISTFIGQYYQSQPVPPLLIVGAELSDATVLEEALKLNSGNKVEIHYPQRGDKRALVEQAERNARDALKRHQSASISQRDALKRVQELFGLPDVPARIEVYDNSHISGTHAVGGMIVAGPDGFTKNAYRKFDIRLQPEMVKGGDDYAMLREVLTRRFKRLHDVDDESGKVPDLVMIDGGAGQLSVATEVFEELGIADIPYVAISKGPDRNAGREFFHRPDKPPFQLPEHDPTLQFLQRLRDEAHRFAIGTHRNKRSKTMQTSELDMIAGIGSVRKKALLLHFGSARAVAAASIEEIAQVQGINRATAAMIHAHFHGDR
jgi:excinuclease ABC subunit C